MARYALIRTAPTVENCIEADADFIASLQGFAAIVEVPPGVPCGPGYVHSNGAFAPPAPPIATRHITQFAFISRFRDDEAIKLDLASIGATVQAAAMRRYMQKVNAASHIDLDRQDTRDGVLALEAMRLIGPGRALEILDAPVQAHEAAG